MTVMVTAQVHQGVILARLNQGRHRTHTARCDKGKYSFQRLLYANSAGSELELFIFFVGLVRDKHLAPVVNWVISPNWYPAYLAISLPNNQIPSSFQKDKKHADPDRYANSQYGHYALILIFQSFLFHFQSDSDELTNSICSRYR